MEYLTRESHCAILENSNRNDLKNLVKSNNDQFYRPTPELKISFNSIVLNIKYLYATQDFL